MSETDATPQASSGHGMSNIWRRIPSTLTGIGIIASALVPVAQGGEPTTIMGWTALLIAGAVAVERALGGDH